MRSPASRISATEIIACLVMLLGTASLIMFLATNASSAKSSANRAENLPEQPISLATAHTRGSESARVAVIEFSDFQCPFCGVAATTLVPQVEERFVKSNQVLLAFWHLPLESLHPLAFGAATAAECAGEQSHFWEMHDLLFEQPSSLEPTTLERKAVKAGLEMSQFRACSSGSGIEKVKSNARDAERLEITGTPAFLVGRYDPASRTVTVTDKFSGVPKMSNLEAAIRRLLPGAP